VKYADARPANGGNGNRARLVPRLPNMSRSAHVVSEGAATPFAGEGITEQERLVALVAYMSNIKNVTRRGTEARLRSVTARRLMALLPLLPAAT